MTYFRKALPLTIIFIFALIPTKTLPYGIGQVARPLPLQKKIISAEIIGMTSTGGGIGVQGRYTQKINQKLTLDGGIGVSSGEYESRFFLGADLEIFPDYRKQPRFSLKTTYINAREFDIRCNILSLAPIISKGFHFGRRKIFPYLSFPFAINFDSKDKKYETQINGSLGITGPFPIGGNHRFIGNFEITAGLKDSYTAILAGISYPLN